MWKKELTATIQNEAKKAKLSGSTFHVCELNGKLDVVREKHNRTLSVIEYPGSITNLEARSMQNRAVAKSKFYPLVYTTNYERRGGRTQTNSRIERRDERHIVAIT